MNNCTYNVVIVVIVLSACTQAVKYGAEFVTNWITADRARATLLEHAENSMSERNGRDQR